MENDLTNLTETTNVTNTLKANLTKEDLTTTNSVTNKLRRAETLNEVLRIPIIFSVHENDYGGFLEFINKFRNKYLSKITEAELAKIDAHYIPNSFRGTYTRMERNSKDFAKKKIIECLNNNMDKTEKGVKIGLLFKKCHCGGSYKSFQRYIAELAFQKQIVTTKLNGGLKGNTTIISLP